MARTVIIGDVHGCLRELDLLLGQIGFGADDRICFVGDLVSRGPDSRGVLRLARELNASTVLGNHEWRLLEAHRALRQSTPRPPLGPSQVALLKILTDDEWEWLEQWPLVVDMPAHDVRIVHAGFVPGIPIESQSPGVLTRIRSVTADGDASERLGNESWAAGYRGRPHIVFGHNAQRGLQLHHCATGLDTGCVYGGALSAIVLEAEGRVPERVEARRSHLVSVPAAEVYFQPRSRGSKPRTLG